MKGRSRGGVAGGWNAACQSLMTWYVPGQSVGSAALGAVACRGFSKAPLLEKIRSDAEARLPRGFEIIVLSRGSAERADCCGQHRPGVGGKS